MTTEVCPRTECNKSTIKKCSNCVLNDFFFLKKRDSVGRCQKQSIPNNDAPELGDRGA